MSNFKGLSLEQILSDLSKLGEKIKESLPKVNRVFFIYYPGRELQVVINGETFVINNPTNELRENIQDAKREGNIQKIRTLIALATKVSEEDEENLSAIVDKASILVNSGDFEVLGNSVYMKGIKRSLPELLINKFVEILSKSDIEQYKAHKNFWYWCCLNPRAEVADSLFDFLSNNYLRLNTNGFFYALRNVVTVKNGGGTAEYVKFISEQFVRTTGWGRVANDYSVYKKDNGYILLPSNVQSENFIGKLGDLYKELYNIQNNTFTDAHTRSFDIRIGTPVTMPLEKCRWHTGDCGAAGLHFTMNQLAYVGCGDTSVIMLINPMKVVGVGREKGRCYEYLPICSIPTQEANDFLRNGEFNSLALEKEYYAEEVKDLEQKVKENFTTEFKKYSYDLPAMSTTEIKNVTSILEDRIHNFDDDTELDY